MYIKEEGQDYSEIVRTDPRANDQKIVKYITGVDTTYGPNYFDIYNVCKLSLKAGVNYTVKLQARTSIHIENIFFAYGTDATIALV